jgi:TonB family protein
VVLLPPSIGTGQRLSDINDPQYSPRLPPALNRSGMIVWGMFRICVTTDGRVSDVRIVKSADALVDDGWMQTIRRWQYRPYSIEGRAVPFCHAMRIEARAAS